MDSSSWSLAYRCLGDKNCRNFAPFRLIDVCVCVCVCLSRCFFTFVFVFPIFLKSDIFSSKRMNMNLSRMWPLGF